MATKEIRCYVNGAEYICENTNEAFALGIQTLICNMKYMSDENIKIWLKQIWDMLYDKEEGLGCRLAGRTINFKQFLDEPYMRGKALIKFVYEQLLKKEGLGIDKEVYVNRFGDRIY